MSNQSANHLTIFSRLFIRDYILESKNQKLFPRVSEDEKRSNVNIRDKSLYKHIDWIDWKLLGGLNLAFVECLISEMLDEVADRVKFHKEFLVVNSPINTTRVTQYCLLYPQGQCKYVTKNVFNHTRGKFKGKSCNGYFKEVLVAQSFVSDFVKGIQVILRAVTAAGKESSMPVVDKGGILDIIRVLLSVMKCASDSFDFLNITRMLVDLYAVFNRVEVWIGQSFDALALSALTMCLPKGCFEILKRMSVLSSAKFVDDFSMFSTVVSYVIDFVKIIISPLPPTVKDCIYTFIDKIAIGEHHRIMQNIKELTSKWRKNPAVMLESSFRAEVDDLESKRNNVSIIEWSRRSAMVKALLDDFSGLVKAAKGFKAARRVEPSCFVFEGPPGVFKSVIMTSLVEIMQRNEINPRTVYFHSIKSVKDGKDFYDIYNNEDMFVMDDLGQQGVSQYRSLINWVSEVPFPMDCAEAFNKNTKYFNSSVIMFTTNDFSTIPYLTKDDCISSREALWRRAFVFDFANIKRKGSELKGIIQLKWFDEESKTWKFTSPDYLPELPMCVDSALGKKDILVWMLRVVRSLEDYKKSNSIRNTMSVEEMNNIMNASMEESFYDASPFESSPLKAQTWEWLSGDSITGFASLILDHISSYVDDFDVSASWKSGTAICGLLAICVCGLVYSLFRRRKLSPESLVANSFVSPIVQMCSDFPKDESPSTPLSFIQRSIKYVEIPSSQQSCICMVSGHCVVMPYHLVVGVDKGHTVELNVYADSLGTQLVYDHTNFSVIYVNQGEDIVILRCNDKIASPFKNMGDKIGFAGDVNSLCTPVGIVPLDTLKLPSRSFSYVHTSIRGDYTGILNSQNSICYKDVAGSGVCGSVLCSKLGLVKGMHVAGRVNNSLGASIVWSASTCEEVARILSSDNKYLLPFEIKPEHMDISAVKLTAAYSASLPSKSHMIPSPMYNTFPVERGPANLSIYGKNTVNVQAEKAFTPLKTVPQVDLEFGELWLKSIMKDFKPITICEVIKGTPNMAGLNKKSSNGFGYQQGKEKYVNFEDGTLTALGRAEYDRVLTSIKNGSIDPKDFVWQECLKDELRDNAKIDNPRTFRCCSVIMQIITKQVFGGFVQYIMDNKWNNGIMVGINPLKDFEKIRSKLQQMLLVWGLDFKKWDGAMLTQVQERVAKVISSYCDPEWRDVCEFVLFNMAHCLVLIRNDLYFLTHSMPSGSFLTAILNSVINRFYTAMWYSWCARTDGESPCLLKFMRDVLDFVYGDDKLNGVNPTYSKMTMLGMAEYFKSMGLDSTTSTKEKVDKESERLEDITFLKRSFVYSPRFNKLVCPLDKKTLLSSMSWYNCKKDVGVVMHGKLSAFQREAFLHEDYDYLMNVVKQSLSVRGIEHDFLSEGQLTQLLEIASPDYFIKDYTTFEEL